MKTLKHKTKKEVRPTKSTLGISYLGVDLNAYRTKTGWKYTFRSRIRKNGVQIHLGCFKTVLEAAEKYNQAAKSYLGLKKAKQLGRWNDL